MEPIPPSQGDFIDVGIARLDLTEPPEEKSLLGILSLYPIFDTLCSHLDIGGLLTLRKISKRLGTHLSTHMKARWNINRHLCRFVRDPLKFRSEMARREALLAGSFVTQFFDYDLWEGSSLDVYLHDGEEALAFYHYLRRVEGYKLEIERVAGGYSIDHITKTQTYERRMENGEEATINIIFTRHTPIQTIMCALFTTALVNILSWNKAYSIFPDVTFLDPRRTYPLKRIDGTYAPLFAEFEDCGWTTADPIPEEDLYSIQVKSPRHVGDSQTWTIALDTTGVQPSTIPDYVLESSSFELDWIRRNYRYTHYDVEARLYEACVLKYKYVASDSLSRDFWESFLRKKLDDLTRAELKKLSEEDMPEFMLVEPPPFDLFRYNSLFEKPPTWTFYDHMVPQWREEWVEYRRNLKLAENLATEKELPLLVQLD